MQTSETSQTVTNPVTTDDPPQVSPHFSLFIYE